MYQKFYSSFMMPLYQKMRGRSTFKHLSELEDNQRLTKSQIAQIQFNKLAKILHYSYNNIPYYKNKWNQAAVKPIDINSVEDLQKIPVLTKDEVRQNYEALINYSLYKEGAVKSATGGSTGQPLKFVYNREEYDRRLAAGTRSNRWLGWDYGEKTVWLWGPSDNKGLKKLKENVDNFFQRKMLLDVYQYSYANMMDYVLNLKQFKPKFIIGYVNGLFLLAKYIISKNITYIQPDGIISTSDLLLPYQKEIIEQAFQCKVYNRYGCREIGLIAAECKHREGFHINEDNVVVELLEDNSVLKSEDVKSIVVTSLDQYLMPFIRYRVEDITTSFISSCSCNRPFKMVDTLLGRRLDVIQTPDGKMLPGEFFPCTLKDFDGILEFSVEQKNLNSVVINFVKGESFREDDFDKFKTIIRDALGEKINIDYRFVDKVEIKPSGKSRLVISNVTPGFE